MHGIRHGVVQMYQQENYALEVVKRATMRSVQNYTTYSDPGGTLP
jgi:hypothetical protein